MPAEPVPSLQVAVALATRGLHCLHSMAKGLQVPSEEVELVELEPTAEDANPASIFLGVEHAHRDILVCLYEACDGLLAKLSSGETGRTQRQFLRSQRGRRCAVCHSASWIFRDNAGPFRLPSLHGNGLHRRWQMEGPLGNRCQHGLHVSKLTAVWAAKAVQT